jgi:SAM-dependent methyltransferase
MAVFPANDEAGELAAHYVKNVTTGVWTAIDAAAAREFHYSDGDELEERLLSIVRNASDLGASSDELQGAITDFASRYYLSSSRANLLRPVAHLLRGRVLEIGAGCGAVTRFLGEQALDVVAVEGSPRRAAIAAARCRDLPNVAVVASALQDLAPLGCFDAVTLIGVLEYARRFAVPGDPNPFVSALSLARSFLRPGGALVLAIENQLGLKYFALYPEDHIGRPSAGIENRYGPETAATFGRAALARLLRKAGLPAQQWSYPFPDYKFPILVLSAAGAATKPDPAFAWAVSQTGLADPQRPVTASFALQRVWSTIWRNGLAGDLANSFLVVASDMPLACDESLLATYYGGPRRRALQKETRFVREAETIRVCRARLFPAEPVPPELGYVLCDETLVPGHVLEELLVDHAGRDGWDVRGWLPLMSPWFAALRENFRLPGTLGRGYELPASAIDALPRNLVVSADGSAHFIDREWQPAGTATLGYIYFRAFLTSLLSIEQCAPGAPGQTTNVAALIRSLFEALGWELSEAEARAYVQREAAFQTAVSVGPAFTFEIFEALELRVRPDLPAMERARAELPGLERRLEEMSRKADERAHIIESYEVQRSETNEARRAELRAALEALQQSLALAAGKSAVRTEWPSRLRGPLFRLPKVRESFLAALSFAFKDQRHVNDAFAAALRESLGVNEKLILEVDALREELETLKRRANFQR